MKVIPSKNRKMEQNTVKQTFCVRGLSTLRFLSKKRVCGAKRFESEFVSLSLSRENKAFDPSRFDKRGSKSVGDDSCDQQVFSPWLSQTKNFQGRNQNLVMICFHEAQMFLLKNSTVRCQWSHCTMRDSISSSNRTLFG